MITRLLQQLLLVFLLIHFFSVTFLAPHVNLGGENCATDLAAPRRRPPQLAQSEARRNGNDAPPSSNLGAVVFLGPQRLRSAFKYTRVCLLKHAIESVDRHLNSRFGPYPVFIVIASDYELDPEKKDAPYTEVDREAIRSNLLHTNVTFVEVPMYSGEALEADMSMGQFDRWNAGKDGGTGGRPIGYRSMCRLWSGRLQQMGFLKPYKYYMRMDDDSLLTGPFPSDPFVDMQSQSLQYVYKRPFLEPHGNEFIVQMATPFMDETVKDNMLRMGMLHRKVDNSIAFLGTEPYNNFHMAKVSMFSEPKWVTFMQVLDKYHGFFKHRLGDATVHTFAMGLLLRPEEVAMWNTVPYVHNINDMPTYPPSEWAGECGNLAFFKTPKIEVAGDTGGKLKRPAVKIEGLEGIAAPNKKGKK